jgi:hypothetical protein
MMNDNTIMAMAANHIHHDHHTHTVGHEGQVHEFMHMTAGGLAVICYNKRYYIVEHADHGSHEDLGDMTVRRVPTKTRPVSRYGHPALSTRFPHIPFTNDIYCRGGMIFDERPDYEWITVIGEGQRRVALLAMAQQTGQLRKSDLVKRDGTCHIMVWPTLAM